MMSSPAVPALQQPLAVWLTGQRRRLEGLARRLVWDEEEARDLVQAAYLDALARPEALADARSAEAWLQRLVVNRALSHLRRRRLWRVVAQVLRVADEPVAAGPEEDAERRAHQARLAEALEALPARQAVAFSLRYLEGHSLDEVADALSVSRGTVRVHLQRAVKVLRRRGVLP
jgi:RNA polymerase sigma-70 factor (ECF subfamily)